MPNCIDQILCNQASDCEILITDANGLEIDTRYLHDGDAIYLKVSKRIGYTLTGFTFIPYDGTPEPITPELMENGLYKLEARCGGTFVANYTTNLYTLNVIPDNPIHGSTLGSGVYPYNTVVHITAIENPGYHFIGWYINNVLISTDIEYAYTVTEDVYIVAHFEGDMYSIVAKPNSVLLGSASGSGVYEYSETVTLVATPEPGCTFVSWDDGDTSLTKTITATQNKVYIAIFQRNSYTVTLIIINNSTTRPTDIPGIVTGEGTYFYGSVVTLFASPALGFSFISWDNGSEHVDNNTSYSFTVMGDTTVYATFDDAMYDLTLYCSPVDGGITTNGVSTSLFTGGTYRYGETQTVEAKQASGYAFDRWSDGTTTAIRTFTMTSDVAQTAYFVKQKALYRLKITFDSNKGNVVIMNGAIDVTTYGSGYVYADVYEGTTLTAIVTETAPYQFVEWDDDPSQGMTRVFYMDGNFDREVYFNDLAYYRICICAGFQWILGHFIAYVDGVYEKDLVPLDRCVEVPYGSEVAIEYAQDNTYYTINTWDTSGLGDMSYSIETTPYHKLTIDSVTDHAEICASTIQCKANIRVKNNPESVLDGLINFSISCDGITDIKTPNPSMQWVGPFDTYPTALNYSVTVNTPVVPGYYFAGLFADNGAESYGTNTISGSLPNSGIEITCLYEEEACSVDFTFDRQNVSTVSINGNNYRSDTTGIDIMDGISFTVIPDANYYINDVIDLNTGLYPEGNSIYCYEPYPFVINNRAYYYKVDYTPISGVTYTDIYSAITIIDPNDPNFQAPNGVYVHVKLHRYIYYEWFATGSYYVIYVDPVFSYIRNGYYPPDGVTFDASNTFASIPSTYTGDYIRVSMEVYASIITDPNDGLLGYNMVGASNFNDIWNDLSFNNYYGSVQYPDSDEKVPMIDIAQEKTPLVLYFKGFDGLFVKIHKQCTYEANCNHAYHVTTLMRPISTFEPSHIYQSVTNYYQTSERTISTSSSDNPYLVYNNTASMPSTHNKYESYRVLRNGVYLGEYCYVNDYIVCTTDGTVSNINDWAIYHANQIIDLNIYYYNDITEQYVPSGYAWNSTNTFATAADVPNPTKYTPSYVRYGTPGSYNYKQKITSTPPSTEFTKFLYDNNPTTLYNTGKRIVFPNMGYNDMVLIIVPNTCSCP